MLSERLSFYDTIVQRIWLYFFLLVSSKCKGLKNEINPNKIKTKIVLKNVNSGVLLS